MMSAVSDTRETESCYVLEDVQPGGTGPLEDGVVYYMPNLSTYYGGISFKTKADRVNFYHAALGYPTVSGFVAALKSHLKLPGITAADVLENPPKTEATAKGHLRQHIKGVCSTKRYTSGVTAGSSTAGVQDSEGGNSIAAGTPSTNNAAPATTA